MSLRRLSSRIPDPEQLRFPPPGSAGRPNKALATISRSDQIIAPMRFTPKPIPSTSSIGTTINSKLSFKSPKNKINRGCSRVISSTLPDRQRFSDVLEELDGIAVLPPSVPKCESKKSKNTSLINSRIPCRSGSGTSSHQTIRTKTTVTAKRRLTVSRQTSKDAVAPHPRVSALAKTASPASKHSLDSIDQFEADELAAALPTPAPMSRLRPRYCQSDCAQVLQEIKAMQKDMVLTSKQFLVKQTELFEKQSKLIEKQTEVLCKLNSLLEKGTLTVCNDRVALNAINLMDVSEKENSPAKSQRRSIGTRATSQYNNIRADFNFLSLKTPGKTRTRNCVLTPKTPKSILSRTLQMQVGDLFEES